MLGPPMRRHGCRTSDRVIPLVTSHAPMLSRTLLYTAITRAGQLVVIVSQEKALSLAVRDWGRTPRQTALGGLIGGTLHFGVGAGPRHARRRWRGGPGP